MILDSFRELLLKKAEGNYPLINEILSLYGENLLEVVVESLEKTQKSSKNASNKSTGAIVNWAGNLTSTDVEQMRDALSHHISHYRAALRNNNREVADQHLSKILPMLHWIQKAEHHSHGLLSMRHVRTRPWEQNYRSHFTRQQAFDLGLRGPLKPGVKPTDDHNETHGLAARPAKGKDLGNFAVPDYRFLEMPYNPYGDKPPVSGPNGSYPFEEIRVGSDDEIANGEGYVDIYDPGKKDHFEPHPYDSHPLFNAVDKKFSQEELSGKENEIAEATKAWKEQTADALERLSNEADERNPYRGRKKSDSFFEGTPMLPRHIYHESVAEDPPETDSPKKNRVSNPGQQSQAAPAESKSPSTIIRRKSATVAPSVNWDDLPAEIRAKHAPKQEAQPEAQPQPPQPQPENKNSGLHPELAAILNNYNAQKTSTTKPGSDT